MSQEVLSQGLIKLSGIIANYRCTRKEANFMLTEGDQTRTGVIAVAAALAGLSGAAASTASSANMEEDGDYVEFDLNGQPVKGWVWRSPFKNGDSVEVAAEWQGDHYETGGILRPDDRMIALYPHCSRGKNKHVANAVKWWLIGATFFVGSLLLSMVLTLPMNGAFLRDLRDVGSYMMIGCYIVLGLITFRIARKLMPFVHLSEKVFTTLGLPNPPDIDLVKSSKAQRQPSDPAEFWTFYFRY